MVFAVKWSTFYRTSQATERVVLNGECLSFDNICTGVMQRSVLRPFLFLIYINDLQNDIKSKWKLFVDDTSLFSVVHGIDTSANDLNHDLEKISGWTFQWKMKFNPDSQTCSRNNIQQENICFYPPSCLFY